MLNRGLQRLLDSARRSPREMKLLERALRKPERFARLAGKALASAASASAPRIFQSLKTRGPAMLRERRTLLAGFERRLYRAWKRPLDLLEMFIVICAETGEGISAQWSWKDPKGQDRVFDIVRRLQARACQVACEILTLLKAGFAPAAHARWRTLHETVVTACFIAEHGRMAAELYRDHEYTEAKKAARLYQRYARRLGYARISPREMTSLRRRYATRLKKHGAAFKDDQGWAAVVLGQKRATIADVEKAVKLDHLRPFYRMASHPVHAGVKSIRFSLALEQGTDILLTGPSNLGLTDPGHSAAISLGQITTTLVFLLPTSDSISVGRVLQLFIDEIGEAFIEAHHKLEARGHRPKRSAAERVDHSRADKMRSRSRRSPRSARRAASTAPASGLPERPAPAPMT